MIKTGVARLPFGENRLGDLFQIAAPDLLSNAAKQEKPNACYYIDNTTFYFYFAIKRAHSHPADLAHHCAAFHHSCLASFTDSGGKQRI